MTAGGFVQGFAEIVLVVEDVGESARFYRDVVGLEPQGEPTDDWAWFWVGPPAAGQRLAVHRGTLLFEEHSPHAEGGRWGHVHFAVSVRRDRLAHAVEHVRSAGVEVYGPVYFEWMRASGHYFYDPDGNLVELWSPDPD